MITVTVTYPRQNDARFDFDYYVRSHLPLVASTWRDQGVGKVGALKGIAAADGSEPPYLAMALIEFESMDALAKAMAGEGSAKVAADISNYTNVAPIIQINETIA